MITRAKAIRDIMSHTPSAYRSKRADEAHPSIMIGPGLYRALYPSEPNPGCALVALAPMTAGELAIVYARQCGAVVEVSE